MDCGTNSFIEDSHLDYLSVRLVIVLESNLGELNKQYAFVSILKFACCNIYIHVVKNLNKLK